jgi:hypothetical protein
MAQLESQDRTAQFPVKPLPHEETGEIGAFSAPLPPPSETHNQPGGGLSIIPVPRREIARLQGTLRLSGLPRHKPTIVFDTSRRLQDTDDE